MTTKQIAELVAYLIMTAYIWLCFSCLFLPSPTQNGTRACSAHYNIKKTNYEQLRPVSANTAQRRYKVSQMARMAVEDVLATAYLT